MKRYSGLLLICLGLIINSVEMTARLAPAVVTLTTYIQIYLIAVETAMVKATHQLMADLTLVLRPHSKAISSKLPTISQTG